MTAFNSGALILHRIFYYYQHLPADPSVCNGGQVDRFGRCVCPERYTGDYCWDRICQPPATYSYGMCSCPPGYYGDFCEIGKYQNLVILEEKKLVKMEKILFEDETQF